MQMMGVILGTALLVIPVAAVAQVARSFKHSVVLAASFAGQLLLGAEQNTDFSIDPDLQTETSTLGIEKRDGSS